MGLLIGFIAAIALLIILLYRVMKNQEAEQENRMLHDYMESMKSFYAILQKRIETTREYRHDLAKHIRTLEYLSRQGDEGLELYMDDLKNTYTELRKEQLCCDEVVNSILALREEQCREKKIPLQLEVEDIVYGGLPELDLVGLLYNLLDNAVEASERIPEGEQKGIRFAMGIREEKLWMEVDNYIASGEELSFETKKVEKEEHGVGIRIIDSIIEKYHGKKEIQLEREKHLVRMSIEMQNIA